MTQRMRLLVSALGALVLGTGLSSPGLAQCGGPAKKVSYQTEASSQRAQLRLAGWGGQSTDAWGDERDASGLEPIVGLWKMKLEDKADNYMDQGYSSWHSDFTEFYNSERAPGTGAVCQGVWAKVGRSTYVLNHFALAYNGSVSPNGKGQTVPDEVAPANIIQIKAVVTVGRYRKNFQGTFTLTVYDPKHNPLVTYTGPITGQRVSIGTTIDSQ